MRLSFDAIRHDLRSRMGDAGDKQGFLGMLETLVEDEHIIAAQGEEEADGGVRGGHGRVTICNTQSARQHQGSVSFARSRPLSASGGLQRRVGPTLLSS